MNLTAQTTASMPGMPIPCADCPRPRMRSRGEAMYLSDLSAAACAF